MGTWKKIGCAVDGSPASLEALRTAADLARRSNAELVLVHVESQTEEAMLAPPPAQRRTTRAHPMLTEWADLARELRGGPVRLELGWGPAAKEIVAFAQREGCDLLVVGTGAKHSASFALGSTAAKVVPHAPCSVLLVRPR